MMRPREREKKRLRMTDAHVSQQESIGYDRSFPILAVTVMNSL